MAETPINAPRRSHFTLGVFEEPSDRLFGRREDGTGVVEVPVRMLEALGWSPGAKLTLSIVELGPEAPGCFGLLVERESARRKVRV